MTFPPLGNPLPSMCLWEHLCYVTPDFCLTSLEGGHLSFWIFSFTLPQACVASALGLALVRQGLMTQVPPCPPEGPSLMGKTHDLHNLL